MSIVTSQKLHQMLNCLHLLFHFIILSFLNCLHFFVSLYNSFLLELFTISGSKKKQIHNPEENDNKILSLQIECLQAQLEEQTKHAKENVEALVADRKVKEEELEARRLRDEEKIRVLLEK